MWFSMFLFFLFHIFNHHHTKTEYWVSVPILCVYLYCRHKCIKGYIFYKQYIPYNNTYIVSRGISSSVFTFWCEVGFYWYRGWVMGELLEPIQYVRWGLVLYRNLSIYLHSKSIDWFLYCASFYWTELPNKL